MFLGDSMNIKSLLIVGGLVSFCAPATLAQDIVALPAAEASIQIEALTEEAKGGDVSSAFKLAKLLVNEQHYGKAEPWLRFAFFKGNGRAALSLYDLHVAGHLELEDATKIRDIGLMMVQDNASKDALGSSALVLARHYMKGQYGPADYQKALYWLRESHIKGNVKATYMLGNFYMDGLLHSSMPRKALHYYDIAAGKGFADAIYELAVAHHTGIGRKKDIDSAIQYYQKAADQGHVRAMRDLASIYSYDLPDQEKRKSWLERAAALQDIDAHYYLGEMIEGTDPERAIFHYKKASEQKMHMARVKLEDIKAK